MGYFHELDHSEWYGAKKKFEKFWLLLTLQWLQASILSHFSTISENEVLIDFIDFGRLDMLDIAYPDSTNCSRPRDNQ